MAETTLAPVKLENGATLYVEATAVDGTPVEGADDLISFGEVKKVIEQLGGELWDALKAISPDKATVEFDLDLALKAGLLTAILVKHSAQASLKITLEWDKAGAPAAA
jgi:hypothetical protein